MNVESRTTIDKCHNSEQYKNVSITIVGDFVPGEEVTKKLVSGDIENVFGDVIPLLQSSNFSIINLETPLSKDKKRRWDLAYFHKSDPALAKSLVTAGFDIASLANNHILDLADGGVADTLEACNRACLRTVGAGRNLQEASKPLILDAGGVKIAILAVAENEFSIAAENSAGANPLDVIENCKKIIQLREMVDHTILILHGGNEYWRYPRPGLVKLCHHFADMGVSAIVCHHTHVYGGYEIYNNIPILYGLGNFFFERNDPIPDGWNHGLIVRLEIDTKGLISVRIIPCENQSGRVVILNGASREKVLRKVDEISGIICDAKLLQAEWEKFCSVRYDDYLEYSSCFGFLEKHLRSILPALADRTVSKRIRTLYNVINCESHRELLLYTLRKYMEECGN